MAEIAVITPVGDTRYLAEAVQSVFLQGFQAWEMVTIYDGVPPQSFPGVESLTNRKKLGPAACRNMGVRATTADWILCLDADDRLKPDALAQLYAARCEQGIVYGDLEWVGGDPALIRAYNGRPNMDRPLGARQGVTQLWDWNLSELRKLSGPIGVTALFHRKAWQLVGGWREDLDALEDIELWIRLTERGICGARIDAVTLEYRQHPDSRTVQAIHSQRVHAASKQIREAHAVFMKEGTRMACSTCPGGQPAVIDVGGDRVQPEGTIEIMYIGGALASFYTTPSPITGQRYRVEGRGGPTMFIDQRDAEWLLSLRRAGVAEYAIVEQVAPVPAPARAVLDNVAVNSPIPDITGMNVKQVAELVANTSDALDLRVMVAMEQSRKNGEGQLEPRKTVLKALEARIAELGDAA